MKRSWLWCVAAAVLGIGALVAFEANGNDEAVRSAMSIAVPSAHAQDDGKAGGCTLIGTFATKPAEQVNEFAGTPPWISTSTGTNSSGTIVTDVPHWPNIKLIGPTGEPFKPNAVRMTTLRGVWERTGGNTLAFTQIGWALDVDGDEVYVVRNSGRTTLMEGCNREIVESTLEFFCLEDDEECADPFNPFFFEKIDDMEAHRVTLSPPQPPLD